MMQKTAIKPAQVARERILLVEDEPTYMSILSSYLSDSDFDVVEAGDGEEALRILEKDNQFDMVVSDKRMPKMDGIELAQRMKHNRDLKHIPVIIQTGDTSQEELRKGVQAGVFYYLAKPFDEDTLLTIVRSALLDRKRNEVFEKRISSQRNALENFVRGEFHIRKLDEAQNTAFLLGSLYPRPELAATGLFELLLNAIEHGNLGIGHMEKSRLLGMGTWEAEVERRLAMPENAAKLVRVQFAQMPGRLEVTITDEGQGFAWQPFLEIEPSRATQGSGRGIAKANLISFDELIYQGKGNQVQAICYL